MLVSVSPELALKNMGVVIMKVNKIIKLDLTKEASPWV